MAQQFGGAAAAFNGCASRLHVNGLQKRKAPPFSPLEPKEPAGPGEALGATMNHDDERRLLIGAVCGAQ